MDRKLSDLSVTELKSLLFDIEQQIKVNQNEYSQVINYLKTKLEKETKTEVKESKKVN